MTTHPHPHVHGTLAIPEGTHEITPTSMDDIDAAVQVLSTNAKRWVETTVDERIAIIDQLIRDTQDQAPAWSLTAAVHKRISRGSANMGVDMGTGPYATIRNLRLLRQTLDEIRLTGRPQPPGIRNAPDGQVIVDVLPADWVDRAMYTGWSGEVRIQHGIDRAQVEERMGRIYRPGGKGEGAVATVLGAGNVSSIPAMDVLYKLFVEDRVCLLKMNPVNEYVGPFLTRAFQVLVDQGYLRIVYGGAEQGIAVCQHPDVAEIHITGSDKTHDAIVYGTGEEGERRKAADDRINTRPISSELGSVSPVIVVPGPWSDKDLQYQGDNIASMLINNGGFNCIATRVIVTHRHWNRRGDLLDAIRSSMAVAEEQYPYYPGAEDRWQAFVDDHPEAETYGPVGPGRVPWTLIPDLDPTNSEDIAFTSEAFCGVFGETGLDAPRSVPDFLDQAVDFCNQTLWGSLAATILVHPKSLKDPAIAAAVERAVDRLRYGTVGVNVWAGIGYLVVRTPWGAYPGHTEDDIQSGRGVVHNAFMLEDVEKAVIRAPWRAPVKPWWFHTFNHMEDLTRGLTNFEASLDPRELAKLTLALLKG